MTSTEWKKWLLASLLVIPTSWTAAQEPANASASTAKASTQLSATALKTLVSGIAFYPDDVIADIFAASQDMVSLKAAAEGKIEETSSEELKRLSKDPQILQQLVRYPATTARLALAVRTQLADVWQAIDSLRSEYEASTQADQNAAASSSSSSASATATPPLPRPLARVNAFMAGLVADNVIEEISDASTVVVTSEGNTVAVTDGTATVVAGENGAAAAVTSGDTTKFGAVAGGTVTTPNGSTVTGVGGVKGEVTQTENGASYSKDSAGAVVNNTTGEYAAGKRSTSGSVTNNADGSTSFSRSAITQTNSSYGNTTVTRNSSGTVTGNGDGNFESETTIDSSRGDATISTEAGNGQVNTTVTTDNGTKEFSAGDGEVQNRPESSSNQKSNKSAEGSAAKSGSRVSQDQMNRANNMMAQGWGRLEAHPSNQAHTNNAGARTNFQRNAAATAGQRNTPTRSNPTFNGQRGGVGERGNASPSPANRGNGRSGGGRPGRGR